MTATAGGTSMLDEIVYATVFVGDQDRALDFYTNTLGFEKKYDNPTGDGRRFLTVGLPNHDFLLVLWPGTPGQAEPLPSHIPGAYTIKTGDLRNAYETLKSRGVEFDTDILEYPWGQIAVFQDPDRNRLQLRELREGL
jgi:catechol 2,3-dioxygenase-like lactoylglutathione lyase family enzyme